jgi:signal transduction histidine kinase
VKAKGVSVGVGDLPRIWGQPNQLSHVFVNLLSNAVKYVPSGHGVVEVGGTTRNGHVVLNVRDNGIGIAAHYHQGVFRLFGRVPAAERIVDGKPVDGTGVGLAIVKRIVERHGGLVELESAPGTGSTFRILLPSMRSRGN